MRPLTQAPAAWTCQRAKKFYPARVTLNRLTGLLIFVLCCGASLTLQAKSSNKPDPAFIDDTRTQAYKGDPVAQCAFGNCFEEGYGVPKNYPEAVKWYRRAADQKDPLGQYCLARCYESGKGFKDKDLTEAVNWYRKSAEQGYARAQFALGYYLSRGKGPTNNLVEAHKWYDLASQQGIADAKPALAKLERKLKPEQLAQARQMAAAFVPPHPMLVEESDEDTADVGEHPKASGTGFFVTDDGCIVTSAALVKDATRIRVVCGQRIFRADLAKLDLTNGLALLKTKGYFEPLPLVADTTVQRSNTVYTVGFADLHQQGLEARMQQGRIAALTGPQGETNLFELNMPVEAGNLGGALVDARGNVVGVLCGQASPSGTGQTANLNSAIKSGALQRLLDVPPQTSVGLAETVTTDQKYEDVIKAARQATVMVIAY
jgi:S1-C subfamily serine protease